MIPYGFPILTVYIKLQKAFLIGHSNPVGGPVVPVTAGLNPQSPRHFA